MKNHWLTGKKCKINNLCHWFAKPTYEAEHVQNLRTLTIVSIKLIQNAKSTVLYVGCSDRDNLIWLLDLFLNIRKLHKCKHLGLLPAINLKWYEYKHKHTAHKLFPSLSLSYTHTHTTHTHTHTHTNITKWLYVFLRIIYI